MPLSSASLPLFVRGVQFLHTIRGRETAILILAHGSAASRSQGGNAHRHNENRRAWNSQIDARPPFRRGPAIPGVSSGSTSRSPGRTKRYSSAGGAGRHSPPAPRIPGNPGRPTSRGLRRSSKQASRRSTGPHRCVPVSDAAAPPSDSTATVRPETAWKAPGVALRSGCIGKLLCLHTGPCRRTLHRRRNPGAPNEYGESRSG